MKSWQEVADHTVKCVAAYAGKKRREVSRVRLSLKSLKEYRGMPECVPMLDADWREMQIAFGCHGFLVIPLTVAQVAMFQTSKAETWPAIGLDLESLT